MSNKYLYLSSLNSNNAADFEVSLPAQVTIQPYSEIRVLSVSVNPKENMLEITDKNDTFYIGIDNWLNERSVMPLIAVTMEENVWSLQNAGEGAFETLEEMIRTAIEDAMEGYCLFRGGSTCSMAGGKLNIKLSKMQLYECPTIELTDSVLEYWRQFDENSLEAAFTKGDDSEADQVVLKPMSQVEPTQLVKDTDYYGVVLQKRGKRPRYHVSAPIVTGLSGATNEAQRLSHLVECDLSTLAEVDEEGLTGFKSPGHYVKFYFGDVQYDDLGTDGYWGSEDTSTAQVDAINDLSRKYIYSVEFSNKLLILRYHYIDETGNLQTIKTKRLTGSSNPKYTINNTFRIKCHQYEDDYRSYFHVEVQSFDTGADDWVDMFNETFPALAVRHVVYGHNPNRLGVEIFTPNATDGKPDEMVDKIRYTAAVDDPDEKNGFYDDGFKARVSVNEDVNRLLTVVTDYDSPKSVQRAMFRAMSENGYVEETPPNPEYFFSEDFVLDAKEPNADMLKFDSENGSGMGYNPKPYTDGVTSESDVQTDSMEYDNMYLSCPSLPLENVSGYANGGGINQILCQIDLEESRTSDHIFKASPNTEQYNTCHNSYPLRLNTIRMRIVDIEGNVVDFLEENTNVTLEIRDNIHMKKMEYMNNIKLLVDNYSKMQPLVQDQ